MFPGGGWLNDQRSKALLLQLGLLHYSSWSSFICMQLTQLL